uniref:Baculovirus polyhedron envelope protein PEP N-terminal domain-containing protein n=1 Tax=Phthorimaea operculella granulovirus TaxID=192584 RepID=A0A481SD00_9BBAC|nr:hypothetical protein PhopGVgp019 [Phthorimaea operculella granulovirus]QBH66244.1 hypothetical protein PhopGVgp019 [Phthorimaea operculella granulovirus]QBH66374.1 hypothetical protein PhopGVgp019 [Phthorimaea operculella granulovirus]QBH66504.1 hypothetical protein PhopGVgp019 [Phthorimaea operculella granulovirus]
MASIPADSKAFIKPFEGNDVTCLVLDAVAWFGADEIVSILKQTMSSAMRMLPLSQKALWRQLEPQVNSEKQFITALGVRMLIGREKNVEPQSCSSYYNNCMVQCPPPRFELSPSLHSLGNIFVNETIYDARAYPMYEEVNSKINRIYDALTRTDRLE